MTANLKKMWQREKARMWKVILSNKNNISEILTHWKWMNWKYTQKNFANKCLHIHMYACVQNAFYFIYLCVIYSDGVWI